MGQFKIGGDAAIVREAGNSNQSSVTFVEPGFVVDTVLCSGWKETWIPVIVVLTAYRHNGLSRSFIRLAIELSVSSQGESGKLMWVAFA